ncbi:MAG: hypothetical protein KKE86_06555 [Planctomycetes bacterium]|nr:hypothetical protein [Planctomycetota bacterium]MBU4398983.1 hypothetical protein [Planctomycetota bacterium]MCG2685195.1 hypothetical protein [Planctomycetales bacterium]
MRAKLIVGIGFLCVLTLGAWRANASVTFDLGTPFPDSAAVAWGTAPPWLTATFTTTGTGTVELVLQSRLDPSFGTEGVKGWYFNFDPSLDPSVLTITPGTISGATAPSISRGEDAYKADGDGYYDIWFAFATTGVASGRFGGNDWAEFTITGTGITENSFDFFSVGGGGQGAYRSAAHVLSVGGENGDSA